MSEAMNELRKKLEDKIPRDAITQRDGGAGKKLDYLTGHYVISRLNDVFGAGYWSYGSTVHKLYEDKLEGKYGPINYVSYRADVRLVVKFPNGEVCEYGDSGFGDGQDKVNPGKAHELAIKEAITDGLKRCARVLGNSMGNGLYDKSGDGIAEEQDEEKPAKAETKAIPRPKLLDLISANSRVIVAKGYMTVEEILKEMEKRYKAKDKSELTDAQAIEFKQYLEATAKGVK